MECDLCLLKVRANVYLENEYFIILDCKSCLVPMAVWKEHTMNVPEPDKQVMKAFLTEYGKQFEINHSLYANLYTNEAIFMFHATTLVFFTGFPAWQQKGDAIYYASYFADKTFNPFVPYPIVGFYFILLTLIIIGLFGLINRQLNKHLPTNERKRLKINKYNLIR